MAKSKASKSAPPLAREAVRQVIEGDIRPMVRDDGGDIRLVGVEGRRVTVALGHLCTRCPAAGRMVRHLIQPRLRERFGEDVVVETVTEKPYFWR